LELRFGGAGGGGGLKQRLSSGSWPACDPERSVFPSGASPLSLSYDGPKSSYVAESAIFIVYEQIFCTV
jgi:hypothetical protein